MNAGDSGTQSSSPSSSFYDSWSTPRVVSHPPRRKQPCHPPVAPEAPRGTSTTTSGSSNSSSGSSSSSSAKPLPPRQRVASSWISHPLLVAPGGGNSGTGTDSSWTHTNVINPTSQQQLPRGGGNKDYSSWTHTNVAAPGKSSGADSLWTHTNVAAPGKSSGADSSWTHTNVAPPGRGGGEDAHEPVGRHEKTKEVILVGCVAASSPHVHPPNSSPMQPNSREWPLPVDVGRSRSPIVVVRRESPTIKASDAPLSDVRSRETNLFQIAELLKPKVFIGESKFSNYEASFSDSTRLSSTFGWGTSKPDPKSATQPADTASSSSSGVGEDNANLQTQQSGSSSSSSSQRCAAGVVCSAGNNSPFVAPRALSNAELANRRKRKLDRSNSGTAAATTATSGQTTHRKKDPSVLPSCPKVIDLSSPPSSSSSSSSSSSHTTLTPRVVHPQRVVRKPLPGPVSPVRLLGQYHGSGGGLAESRGHRDVVAKMPRDYAPNFGSNASGRDHNAIDDGRRRAAPPSSSSKLAATNLEVSVAAAKAPHIYSVGDQVTVLRSSGMWDTGWTVHAVDAVMSDAGGGGGLAVMCMKDVWSKLIPVEVVGDYLKPEKKEVQQVDDAHMQPVYQASGAHVQPVHQVDDADTPTRAQTSSSSTSTSSANSSANSTANSSAWWWQPPQRLPSKVEAQRRIYFEEAAGDSGVLSPRRDQATASPAVASGVPSPRRHQQFVAPSAVPLLQHSPASKSPMYRRAHGQSTNNDTSVGGPESGPPTDVHSDSRNRCKPHSKLTPPPRLARRRAPVLHCLDGVLGADARSSAASPTPQERARQSVARALLARRVSASKPGTTTVAGPGPVVAGHRSPSKEEGRDLRRKRAPRLNREHVPVKFHKANNRGANKGANKGANRGANRGANMGANMGANRRANQGANMGANRGANRRANRGAKMGANMRANMRANNGANMRANMRANMGANNGANMGANRKPSCSSSTACSTNVVSPPSNESSSSSSSCQMLQQQGDEDQGDECDEEPASFCCPISCEIMRDPVVAEDGQTYEREALKKWFESGKSTSPLTRAHISSAIMLPNIALKSLIADWQRERRKHVSK